MGRVLLWANYRRQHTGGSTLSVPSPFDGDPTIPWHYDRISELAPSWAAAGFTDVLLPQPCKTSSGPYPTADGYGIFDSYDIGSKDTKQFGGVPTRFGYDYQLRRAIAVCHAHGLNVLVDVVNHQRSGGRGGVYNYLGADGKTLCGRFPLTPECFRNVVGEDPGIPDVPDDFAFGDELEPENARPARYVWDGLIAAGDWMFRTLGADGARLDDMKGESIAFMKAWMIGGAMRGKWFFGEYASGNRDDTNWWVDQVGGLASATDFDTHYNLIQPMCNQAGAGTYKMAWMQGRGMLRTNPLKAVPFVESMDSDTNGFATIMFNKLLGYAYMVPSEGLPCVYMRDYIADPQCYALGRAGIANMVWVARRLAHGATRFRYCDDHVATFERLGPPGLLVALCNDVWNTGWHDVTTPCSFAPGTVLKDYSGRNLADCRVAPDGTMTFGIPPAADGRGYGFWAPHGHEGALAIVPRVTTQEFFGAADLDIPALVAGDNLVCRVSAAKGSGVHAFLNVEGSISLVSPSGEPVAHMTALTESGYHEVHVFAPVAADFTLTVTYLGA